MNMENIWSIIKRRSQASALDEPWTELDIGRLSGRILKSYVVLNHKTLLVEAADGLFEGKLVVVDVEAVIVVVVAMKAVYSDFLSSSEAAWEEPASEEGSLLDAHNEQGFLSSFLNLLTETPRIAIDLWLKRQKLNPASSLKCLLSRN